MRLDVGAIALLTGALWLAPAQAQQTEPAAVNGCIYNSTPPTLGDRQSTVFQCDINGKLITSGGGGGGGAVTIVDGGSVTLGSIADAAWVSGSGTAISLLKKIASGTASSITTWAGGTLGAMANYGTSPGAVLVPGVNSFTTGAANFGAANAAIPASLGSIGISDGSTSCSGGPCLVAPTGLATGTAGTPATQVVTTQPPWTPTGAAVTGSTGAVTATLAIVANKTNYICGFDVSGIGGTAAISPITVTGLLGGTFTYQGVISSTAGVNFGRQFSQCLPASGVGVAIAVVTTADGTASAVDVQAWGYYQ